MNPEINLVWQELQIDYLTAAFFWQLAVIVGSLLVAWSINGLLRTYVMKHARENWKIAIGGINRVLFPLSSFVFVYIGEFILHHWQSINLLKLASTLLLAMALIRLVVYALRYIFSPSGWVRAMENTIAAIVWIMLVLHLSGLLPEILQALDSVSFGVGKHPLSLLLIIQAVFTILITLFMALWISRVLENKLLRAEQVDMNVRVVLSKLMRVSISLIAILLSLSAIGFDITLLSVFGGALGIGLGIGLQKIASNYISGFIILLDRSIHLGDVITVDTHYGVITSMRTRYTVLRKLDGTEVVIPNETLITSAVMNHSFTDRKVRVLMPLQVSYGSPLELTMKLMQEAAAKQPRIIKDPAPEVQVKGFGESGIDLSLIGWIADPEEGTAGLQSAIYLDIWRAFLKHNIVIPYPQREVRILPNIDGKTET